MFLSPIFDSISKDDYPAAFNEEELRSAAKQNIIDKKVIALGGVTYENIHLLKQYNFGGAVILGDLWNRFNIHTTQDFKELINHFRRLRRAAD